ICRGRCPHRPVREAALRPTGGYIIRPYRVRGGAGGCGHPPLQGAVDFSQSRFTLFLEFRRRAMALARRILFTLNSLVLLAWRRCSVASSSRRRARFTSTSSGHSHVWAKRIIPAAETSIYPSEFTASFHSPATRNFTVPALRAATMGAWFFK